MDAIAAINHRWQATDHPHAVSSGEHWCFFCPRCQAEGQESHRTLMAAMNDALAHKARCPALS